MYISNNTYIWYISGYNSLIYKGDFVKDYTASVYRWLRKNAIQKLIVF